MLVGEEGDMLGTGRCELYTSDTGGVWICKNMQRAPSRSTERVSKTESARTDLRCERGRRQRTPSSRCQIGSSSRAPCS